MKTSLISQFKQSVARYFPAAKRINIFGFSLVEVTLALGITAFGLVALMGMLPKSLSTLQEAGQISAQTRIAQQLIGDVMLNDWKKLDTVYPAAKAAGEIKYFDDQSIEIKTDDPDFSRDLIYIARLRLPAAATDGVKLPGAGNFSTDLRRIIVDIIQSNDTQFTAANFDDDKMQSKVRTFSSIITNMGKEAP